MKILYLRKANIKTSFLRQDYLLSNKKQEFLLYSSSLDFTYDFKNINKELVIELPNEFIDMVNNNIISFEDIHNIYIDYFKDISGYDNVSLAVHLNKSKTNLHMHLSYVDRFLEDTPKLAKKNMFINVIQENNILYNDTLSNFILNKEIDNEIKKEFITRDKTNNKYNRKG